MGADCGGVHLAEKPGETQQLAISRTKSHRGDAEDAEKTVYVFSAHSASPRWISFGVRKNSEGLIANCQNKTHRLPCLGRARVGNRWGTVSPYSPCCFQEYLH